MIPYVCINDVRGISENFPEQSSDIFGIDSHVLNSCNSQNTLRDNNPKHSVYGGFCFVLPRESKCLKGKNKYSLIEEAKIDQ